MQWIENNKTFPRTRIFHEKSSFKWISFKAVDVIIHMRIINQEKESTLIRLRYHKECLFSQYLGCFFSCSRLHQFVHFYTMRVHTTILQTWQNRQGRCLFIFLQDRLLLLCLSKQRHAFQSIRSSTFYKKIYWTIL